MQHTAAQGPTKMMCNGKVCKLYSVNQPTQGQADSHKDTDLIQLLILRHPQFCQFLKDLRTHRGSAPLAGAQGWQRHDTDGGVQGKDRSGTLPQKPLLLERVPGKVASKVACASRACTPCWALCAVPAAARQPAGQDRCSCPEGNTGHKLQQGEGEKHTLRGGQGSWICPRPRTCDVPAMTHRHLSLHLTEGTTAARGVCPLLYQTHSHSRGTAQPQQGPASQGQ